MPWRLARPVEQSTRSSSSDDGGELPLLDAGEARSVRCECCGMAEECTPTYIGHVRERFQGKWVCGLCAEAVKERLAREPALTVGGAVDAHAALCERFNSTMRLNPKLSLASSMRDIARKCCLHRSGAAADGAPPRRRRSMRAAPTTGSVAPPAACCCTSDTTSQDDRIITNNHTQHQLDITAARAR